MPLQSLLPICSSLRERAVAHEESVKDRSGGFGELFQTTLLALSAAALCYFCYFFLSPWIWRQNIPFNPESITPWILEWTSEHDGIEIYALYILMFVNCVTAAALAWVLGSCAGKWGRIVIASLGTVVAGFYFSTIGFTPPMASIQNTPFREVIEKSLFLMAVIFPLVVVVYFLQLRSKRWAAALVGLILAPVCFVATESISWFDYSFVFAPALRLLNGAALHDIYFQYDLLPSLLAAGWMQLGLDLNAFQILGQAGYYVVILGVFLLSEKLFRKKALAIFLVTALILMRIYASPWDAVQCFQVTPLRLDMWLVLVVVVFYLGPYHWSAGLVCGLLILLLKNFGVIYSIAYLQMLITLGAVGYFDSNKGISLSGYLVAFSRRCFVPIMLIVLSGITGYLVFRNSTYGNYSNYYQKLGIGFIQIAANSFYWLVPPVISIVLILLFRLRRSVSAKYMSTGFLLVFCAIGNSIYFFGRSHEHNIINISISLLFVFFLLLDLIERFQNDGNVKTVFISFLRRYVVNGTSIVLIAAIIVCYSQSIAKKSGVQIRNIGKGQLIYPSKTDLSAMYEYFSAIRAITGNSNKVYFINSSDFAFYYYGGFTPVGFCNPFLTWIFASDLNRFLQGLLDDGYYLVTSGEMKYQLTNLRYNNVNNIGSSVVVAKRPYEKTQP